MSTFLNLSFETKFLGMGIRNNSSVWHSVLKRETKWQIAMYIRNPIVKPKAELGCYWAHHQCSKTNEPDFISYDLYKQVPKMSLGDTSMVNFVF